MKRSPDMSYLKENARFLGTGEKDSNGLTLDEFLESYDPKLYDSPCNTVDILVFRSETPYRRKDQPLKLLMIRRKNHPGIGFWACPGGFTDIREDLEDSARRELEEETGVKGLPLVQLRTWGDYDRDPRWRIITTAFLALAEGELPERAGDDAADAAWLDASLELLGSESGTDPETGASVLVRTFRLFLKNTERNIYLSAAVRLTEKKNGLLTSRHYELLSSDKIAADHPLIITDALLYLHRLAE